MNFLENEYRKRFQNKRLSDDKIDADDLWAAIEDKLEVPVPASKPTRYLDWVKKYRFPIASVLLLSSAVFIFQLAKPIEKKPLDAPNALIIQKNRLP
jgi:hypothetical protein